MLMFIIHTFDQNRLFYFCSSCHRIATLFWYFNKRLYKSSIDYQFYIANQNFHFIDRLREFNDVYDFQLSMGFFSLAKFMDIY